MAPKRQALLTPHTQATAKITHVWPVTSLRESCGQSPQPPTWSYSRVTSSASDFLVEKQLLQKCQMCVTFSFLLNRSLEWSPLRQEKKARLLFFHLAGKATCLLRGGVTMSTRPPMVSPSLESVLSSPRVSVSLEGQVFSSLLHLLVFRLLLQKSTSESAFCPELHGRDLKLDWEGSPSRLGSFSDPHNLSTFVETNLTVWNCVFRIGISNSSVVNSWFKSS